MGREAEDGSDHRMADTDTSVNSTTTWGVVGLGAVLVSVGLPLILTSDAASVRVLGAACMIVGFLAPTLWLLRVSFNQERSALVRETQRLVTGLEATRQELVDFVQQQRAEAQEPGDAPQTWRATTDEVLTRLADTVSNLRTAFPLGASENDARFITRGFIGLQTQSLRLDEDDLIGPNHERMAILGHLPSHVRLTEMSLERAEKLYDNWEPPYLVPDYVRLVNRRSKAMRAFLDNGGYVREIYHQAQFSHYVEHGNTFHDLVKDPPVEIIERLNGLLEFLKYPNYSICILGKEEDRPGPYFLLKQGVGLVVDLRTTETDRHFTKSLDGLYTEAPEALQGFAEKFTLTWPRRDHSSQHDYTDRTTVRRFLNDLVAQLSA